MLSGLAPFAYDILVEVRLKRPLYVPSAAINTTLSLISESSFWYVCITNSSLSLRTLGVGYSVQSLIHKMQT